MSIKAIFYSKFDVQEGPKVIHQVPEDSISPRNAEAASSALFSFRDVSSFIIPRQSLCGNLLSFTPPPLTRHSPTYQILGHPVCLTSSHYPRNEFIFNFAIVLPAPTSTEPSPVDTHSYRSFLRKLASLMSSLEEQSHFLSADPSPPGTGRIYSLIEALMSDLNNYTEAMIPIDDLNTLNVKLFPTLPPPPKVRSWHVPLFTVDPRKMMDENWDLTMQRIVPWINGVNCVKRVAVLADADEGLARRCVRHLLFYGCVSLLDLFSFSNIYAVTNEFCTTFISDYAMQRECARYVNRAFEPGATGVPEIAVQSAGLDRPDSFGGANATARDFEDEIWPLNASGKIVDGSGLVRLFASLSQGKTVRQWYEENKEQLTYIDLRRLITFGVIKGFVYRIYRYAIANEYWNEKQLGLISLAAESRQRKSLSRAKDKAIKTKTPPAEESIFDISNSTTDSRSSQRRDMQYHQGQKSTPGLIPDMRTVPRSMSSGISQKPSMARKYSESNSSSSGSDSEDDSNEHNEDAMWAAKLEKYLDGAHCFDQICVELEISEKELVERIAKYPGGVETFCS